MSTSNGWKIERLGDVATCITGGTPSKKDKANYGTYLPLIKPTQLKDDLISEASEYLSEQGAAVARVLPPNSVLVSCIGNLGKTGINSAPVAFNQQINAAVFNDEVEPKFGFYFMQSLSARSQLEKLASATTISIVNKSKFQSVNIPIPETLEEQRRIVAEIEKQFTLLDAGVDGLKRVQANLKRYRAAVLKAACEGKLVPTEAELCQGDLAAKERKKEFETGEQLLERILIERRKAHEEQQKTAPRKKKYKEPSAPDTKDLPDLPKGWAWATVEQVSFLDVGFAFKSKEFSASGIRLLRGENLEPGKMRWTDTRYWPEESLDEFRNLLINEGDIVLAMDRPVVSSGLKIARARIDDLPCLLVQRMARFRPIIENMTSFLFAGLNTHDFIKHLFGNQTGTQLPHISGSGIQSFPISLPPLAEQKRIVEEVERRLSVIKEMEAAVAANLKRAARLRQSILKKAFEGKLVS